MKRLISIISLTVVAVTAAPSEAHTVTYVNRGSVFNRAATNRSASIQTNTAEKPHSFAATRESRTANASGAGAAADALAEPGGRPCDARSAYSRARTPADRRRAGTHTIAASEPAHESGYRTDPRDQAASRHGGGSSVEPSTSSRPVTRSTGVTSAAKRPSFFLFDMRTRGDFSLCGRLLLSCVKAGRPINDNRT